MNDVFNLVSGIFLATPTYDLYLSVSTANSPTRVICEWGAVPWAQSYKVERKVGVGSFTEIYSTTTGLTYTDTSVVTGTEYTYRITFYHSDFVAYSSEVLVTVPYF